MKNKFYYLLVGLTVGVGIILCNRILSLKEIPDTKTFRIHLNTLKEAASKIREDCHFYSKKVKGLVINPVDPNIARGNSALDHIISFGDSADYYFHRLESLQGDPISARLCFEEYSLYSNRFAVFTNEIAGREIIGSQNYLLIINDRLPNGKLPFESEEGVELLTRLLQIEFYERMKLAMTEIVVFSED